MPQGAPWHSHHVKVNTLPHRPDKEICRSQSKLPPVAHAKDMPVLENEIEENFLKKIKSLPQGKR
jgi:hypothetical protein